MTRFEGQIVYLLLAPDGWKLGYGFPIDVEEMRDLVEGAWSRAVPKHVAEDYASAQGYF